MDNMDKNKTEKDCRLEITADSDSQEDVIEAVFKNNVSLDLEVLKLQVVEKKIISDLHNDFQLIFCEV